MTLKYKHRNELMEYTTVKRWMDVIGSKSGSKNTQKNYLLHLKIYCEWIGKTPDELIEERKEHLTHTDEIVKRTHEDQLTSFFQEYGENVARSTAVTKFKTVKSFYKANHYDLKISIPKSWTTYTDKVPSLDEIHKMVEASDSPVQKALILFSAQSGQRAGVVTSMTYGMLREALEGSESPISFHISADLRDHNGKRVNKNRQEYTFFIGRDTVTTLKRYIEYMENKGHVFEDNSPLFVTDKQYAYRDFAGKETTGDKAYRPISNESLNNTVKRLAIRAGLMKEDGPRMANGRRRYQIHHHCLRKFWQTAMEQAGVAKPWYEYMMGHSLGNLDKAYSRPSLEQLQEGYRRAENYLSVSRANLTDLDNIKKDLLLSVIRQQCQIIGFDAQRVVIAEEQDRGIKLTIDEEIEVLQKEVMGTLMRHKVNNNKHEHKIVTEEELPEYLSQGWEFTNKVSEGKFLIKNPIPM